MEALYDQARATSSDVRVGVMKRAVESTVTPGTAPRCGWARRCRLSRSSRIQVAHLRAGAAEGQAIGQPFNGSHFTTLKLLEGFLKASRSGPLLPDDEGTAGRRERGEVAAVSLMERGSASRKARFRVLMESHSTRSERCDELDGATLAKMFRAEASLPRDPESPTLRALSDRRAGGLLETEGSQAVAILNAAPEPTPASASSTPISGRWMAGARAHYENTWITRLQ